MRHGNAGKQLGRDTKHRRSLFRNLVTALLEHGRIETTLVKAKTVRPIAEKLSQFDECRPKFFANHANSFPMGVMFVKLFLLMFSKGKSAKV